MEEFAYIPEHAKPIHNDTEISFIIPEAGDVKITVYDVTGKVLMEKSKNYGKGYNSVSVSRDDLNFTSGVLYYKVENGANISSEKNGDVSKIIFQIIKKIAFIRSFCSG